MFRGIGVRGEVSYGFGIWLTGEVSCVYVIEVRVDMS